MDTLINEQLSKESNCYINREDDDLLPTIDTRFVTDNRKRRNNRRHRNSSIDNNIPLFNRFDSLDVDHCNDDDDDEFNIDNVECLATYAGTRRRTDNTHQNTKKKSDIFTSKYSERNVLPLRDANKRVRMKIKQNIRRSLY